MKTATVLVPLTGLLIFTGVDLIAVHHRLLDVRSELLQRSLVSDGHHQTFPDSLIHDPTIEWYPNVRRYWLEDGIPEDERPPAQLLLTNIGWNHPNLTHGLGFNRASRETNLMRGVVNHPWFHPTAWEEITEGNAIIDPNIRYYVFMDFSTCREYHFPTYAGYDENNDVRGGRPEEPIRECQRLTDFCPFSQKILKSRLFEETKKANIVFFDCFAFGPAFDFRNLSPWTFLPLLMATISSITPLIKDPDDQGLPPPLVNPVHLTSEEERDIVTCEAERKRSIYFSYIGNFRNGHNSEARMGLRQFHDGKTTWIMKRDEHETSAIANLTYGQVLTETIFAAAPRGDNKYSYRFSEVLSAGNIPVILSDDWVWPFRPELVDWSECAVIIPEKQVDRTMDVLANITVAQRCRMRQRCYEIYMTHMQNDDKVIAALIEGWELVASGKRVPLSGVHCPGNDENWKTGDDRTKCNRE